MSFYEGDDRETLEFLQRIHAKVQEHREAYQCTCHPVVDILPYYTIAMGEEGMGLQPDEFLDVQHQENCYGGPRRN